MSSTGENPFHSSYLVSTNHYQLQRFHLLCHHHLLTMIIDGIKRCQFIYFCISLTGLMKERGSNKRFNISRFQRICPYCIGDQLDRRKCICSSKCWRGCFWVSNSCGIGRFFSKPKAIARLFVYLKRDFVLRHSQEKENFNRKHTLHVCIN